MEALRRRILALLVVAALLVTGCEHDPRGMPALAGGIGPLSTTLAYPEPPLLASAVAVLDVDSGRWLRMVNADKPLPMASTTKIMTALLTIEHGHLHDLVRVSKRAASVGQSTMGLVEGERVSMTDLLYGLLVPSGNDAAIAIAEHVSGSESSFVALMNTRAQQLQLKHTHYENPYGFSKSADGDSPGHYSSARDLVTLARYAMRYPLFRKIVNTQRYIVPKTQHNEEHDLRTVDYFIQWYPGADGVKPGWTSGAGVCQVIDAKRDGRHIMAAILNTANVFTDARDLMNYAMRDFSWEPSGHAGDTPDRVVVSGAASGLEWYFPYTGHSVSGAYLTYFRKHGGYAGLGPPETEAVDVDGSLTQYFAAQQLVYNPVAHVVLPVHLGLAAAPGRDWLLPVKKVRNTADTRYYPQTGHSVTNRFLQFYLAHGGPSTFGLPISEKREVNGRLVQYFENAELVWSAKPDDLDGYVYAGPLGIRSLVSGGLIVGRDLPPPLHALMALPSAPRPIVAEPRPSTTALPQKLSRPASATATNYFIQTPVPSPTPLLSDTEQATSTAISTGAQDAPPALLSGRRCSAQASAGRIA